MALIWAAVGALAAACLVWVVRKLGDDAECRAWAAGLVVVALVYVGFALARSAPPLATAFEAGGVVVFALFAGLGVTHGRGWLAAGWLLHPAWDLLHAPGGFALAPAAGDGVAGVLDGLNQLVAARLRSRSRRPRPNAAPRPA